MAAHSSFQQFNIFFGVVSSLPKVVWYIHLVFISCNEVMLVYVDIAQYMISFGKVLFFYSCMSFTPVSLIVMWKILILIDPSALTSLIFSCKQECLAFLVARNGKLEVEYNAEEKEQTSSEGSKQRVPDVSSSLRLLLPL